MSNLPNVTNQFAHPVRLLYCERLIRSQSWNLAADDTNPYNTLSISIILPVFLPKLFTVLTYIFSLVSPFKNIIDIMAAHTSRLFIDESTKVTLIVSIDTTSGYMSFYDTSGDIYPPENDPLLFFPSNFVSNINWLEIYWYPSGDCSSFSNTIKV